MSNHGIANLGPYRIDAELGRGGMGVVYKAYDTVLDRFVAIKVIGASLVDDETRLLRFDREAKAAARLSHPNIVQIFARDRASGLHFIVMEYVAGRSVHDLIQAEGRVESRVGADLILQAAKGLRAAHELGILHRDIKPANLLLNSLGVLKIADFGLARAVGLDPRLTATGALLGTPAYMAPEQYLGRDADNRTDIYSLGVTYFELLTGELPFWSTNPHELTKMIVEAEAPDIRGLVPDVSVWECDAIRRMLAKDPAQRFQHVDEVIDGLERWLSGNEIQTASPVGSKGAVASDVIDDAPLCIDAADRSTHLLFRQASLVTARKILTLEVGFAQGEEFVKIFGRGDCLPGWKSRRFRTRATNQYSMKIRFGVCGGRTPTWLKLVIIDNIPTGQRMRVSVSVGIDETGIATLSIESVVPEPEPDPDPQAPPEMKGTGGAIATPLVRSASTHWDRYATIAVTSPLFFVLAMTQAANYPWVAAGGFLQIALFAVFFTVLKAVKRELRGTVMAAMLMVFFMALLCFLHSVSIGNQSVAGDVAGQGSQMQAGGTTVSDVGRVEPSPEEGGNDEPTIEAALAEQFSNFRYEVGNFGQGVALVNGQYADETGGAEVAKIRVADLTGDDVPEVVVNVRTWSTVGSLATSSVLVFRGSLRKSENGGELSDVRLVDILSGQILSGQRGVDGIVDFDVADRTLSVTRFANATYNDDRWCSYHTYQWQAFGLIEMQRTEGPCPSSGEPWWWRRQGISPVQP